jgi:hypothetical protein
MIFNKTEYNPMSVLVPILTQNKLVTIQELDIIHQQLFLGGIVPENSEEFKKTVELLINTIKEHISG